MNSTYAAVAEFAQTWGLLFFVIAFMVVVVYALWPSNKKRFDAAARTPLGEDDQHGSR
jgi:cytochrome c oxidase cbb3-type subunit 4